MNIFGFLERTARQWPDAPATFLGGTPVHSWAELREGSLRLAAWMREQGAQGQRVLLASENATNYLELLFGTWAAGSAVVPVNYKLHPREMWQIAEDADTALLFVSPSLAGDLTQALPLEWRSRCIVIGSEAYEALYEQQPAKGAVDCDPDTLAWLFYTSGTTGRSKGAMLSHKNIQAMTLAHLADVEALDPGCSQIHAAPMSHGSGLYIPAYVASGARQVVPASQGFDPEEFIDLCGQHPGCGAFLAPTMVQRLRLAAEKSGKRPDVRSIVYGGGPMYVEELKKSLATLGQVFVQIYGQGEAPMTITWLPRRDHVDADEAVLGSVGIPRTGIDVKAVDSEGRDLPAGQMGEIVCRGDVVMSGYWRNADGTAQALRDGWLYTGDMGSFDARGYLTLRDRSKDVVISGGSNIYPREVEEALLTHPAVTEVCVVGEADDEWGEVVVAFVVAAQGQHLRADALDTHCLARIARFKRPKRYVFLDALPKNAYGKVLKRELRARPSQGD